MDVQRSGKINVVAARTFVKSTSPNVSDAQVCLHGTRWQLQLRIIQVCCVGNGVIGTSPAGMS
jgi:hypothetical protein